MSDVHVTMSVLSVVIRTIATITGLWLVAASLWATSGYAISTMLVSGVALISAALSKKTAFSERRHKYARWLLVFLCLGFALQIAWWVLAVQNRVDYPQLGGFVWMHFVILAFVMASFLGMILLMLYWARSASSASSSDRV